MVETCGPGTVLILTDPADVHADAVVPELKKRGVPVFRFHPAEYPCEAAISIEIRDGAVDGNITTPYRQVQLRDIGACWYRRPGRPKAAGSVHPSARDFVYQESNRVLRGLYSLLQLFWINDPNDLALAENKPVQLVRAAEHGLLTPPTIITNAPDRLARFVAEVAPSECVVKTLQAIGVSTEEGWRFPHTSSVPVGSLEEARLAGAIYQPLLRKVADFRCVVVGSQVFSFRIESQRHHQTQIDWRQGLVIDPDTRALADLNTYEPEALPHEFECRLLELVRHFNLHFAAIDVVLTEDSRLVFLELNPNGQWLWLEEKTGVPIAATLADLLAKHAVEKAERGR